MKSTSYTVNLDRTIEDMRKFPASKLAPAVQKAFTVTAINGRNEVAANVEQGLGVKAKRYILQYGIKATPTTKGQQGAFKRAFGKYGDAHGEIYLRGATNVKRSLDFLLYHETGVDRESIKGGLITVPTKTLSSMAYRTSTGKVRKRYKPSVLLEDYNNNSDQQISPDGSGNYYIARRKSKSFGVYRYFILNIDKRKPTGRSKKRKWEATGSNNTELMYQFKESTDQSVKMHFGDTAENYVIRNLEKDVMFYIKDIDL